MANKQGFINGCRPPCLVVSVCCGWDGLLRHLCPVGFWQQSQPEVSTSKAQAQAPEDSRQLVESYHPQGTASGGLPDSQGGPPLLSGQVGDIHLCITLAKHPRILLFFSSLISTSPVISLLPLHCSPTNKNKSPHLKEAFYNLKLVKCHARLKRRLWVERGPDKKQEVGGSERCQGSHGLCVCVVTPPPHLVWTCALAWC